MIAFALPFYAPEIIREQPWSNASPSPERDRHEHHHRHKPGAARKGQTTRAIPAESTLQCRERSTEHLPKLSYPTLTTTQFGETPPSAHEAQFGTIPPTPVEATYRELL